MNFTTVSSLRAGGDNLVILVVNLAPDDSYEPDDACKHPPGPPPGVAYEPITVNATDEP